MKVTGKIAGTILGLLFGGPIGLVFGFILGHLYDIGYFRQFLQVMQSTTHTHAQQIFFNNTFKIMGYIAKSDGRVSEVEIRTARNIMQRMGLNEALKSQAIQLFNIGKQPDFNLDTALNELRQACFMQPALLQLFLEIQYQMASAENGQLSTAKQATLQHICAKLGVAGFTHYQTSGGHYYQQSHQQAGPQPTAAFTLQEAYQLLGISKEASNDEVKKAYRRQMSQNHPDKLIAKGLPPEMIKVATQKTQRIKEAYEKIKASRDF